MSQDTTSESRDCGHGTSEGACQAALGKRPGWQSRLAVVCRVNPSSGDPTQVLDHDLDPGPALPCVDIRTSQNLHGLP
jgi:hypothetical protein